MYKATITTAHQDPGLLKRLVAKRTLPDFSDLAKNLWCRILDAQDRLEILQLRASVFQNLPEENRLNLLEGDAFAVSESEWCDQYLSGRGLTLGVFQEKKMVAFGSLFFPELLQDNQICRLLNMPDDQIVKSAHFAACMVASEFRGFGIQRRLLEWREMLAIEQGYMFLLAMTSSANSFSFENMKKFGMAVVWQGDLRPGRAWSILRKDLTTLPISD
jgi:GNAT superfamily N-acetyltransferase